MTLIGIESPYGATNVVQEGDSGAPVCVGVGSNKKLAAMVIACNYSQGFAIPFEHVLSFLKVNGHI